MHNRFIKSRITATALIVILITIPVALVAQFEQRLSINFSGGYFNTLGNSGFLPEWASAGDEEDPTLMPNFNGGYSLSGGIQYNMSRHFSIEIGFGIMKSPGWYFNFSDDPEESINFLFYEVVADIDIYDIIETGEDEMLLSNTWVGIAPRYYFSPGKKLNPFLFAGVNLDYFNWTFVNNQYEAYERHDLLDIYYEYMENTGVINWFEDSFCLGFFAGVGLEYGVNDYLGFFTQANYYFARLQDSAFHDDRPKQAGFHAINLHLGVRISFVRAKNL